jgi:hypothetical protein
MESMGVEKGVEKPRASDIADNRDPVAGKPHFLKSIIQGMGDSVVGTPRTKYRGALIIEKTIHLQPSL